VDAEEAIRLAKRHLELELGSAIGPLQGRAVRIGHLGSLNELEVLATVGGHGAGPGQWRLPRCRWAAGPTACLRALAEHLPIG